MNMVERFFRDITTERLRRGVLTVCEDPHAFSYWS
jgi:hypothetical protein